MLSDPASIEVERRAKPATGITQAVYPVPQELKSALLVAMLKQGVLNQALVFTRTKHRGEPPRRVAGEGAGAVDAHPRQSFAGAAHRGAGGLQGRALSGAGGHRHRGARHRRRRAGARRQLRRAGDERGLHPPRRPHGRADATGEAYTFVSPDEEADLQAIERAIGKRLPRRTVAGFDYGARAGRAVRGADRRAHRGDPEAQGGGAGARAGEGGAQGAA